MSKLTLDEYIERLSRLTADEVLLNFEQMAEFIGYEKADSISGYSLVINTDMVGQRRKRSVIPKEKQIKKEMVANFNREELLSELNAARSKRDQNSRGTNTVPSQ